ncbi:MAG: GNAT family N-acetyltransferase [Firmicutes bacterium]|uniref:GNAT family N-acetyltransferase n=1 Tax=Candidatus Scybalomonas excrementavium TaxID=2840943 RepID=A0A9D9I1X1_9FIRM|nr:GNAT family N-acetyltransferase [Candidatus Scybalomonas excrementavium]
MIIFKEITKNNYLDVINLRLATHQAGFVTDNATSLVEAIYEEGLYTRAIYNDKTLIGFLLFDYDLEIPGWSLSRFMIDSQYQYKGFGKEAIKKFLEYIEKTFFIKELYVSIELNNPIALHLFHSLGFKDIKKITYTFGGETYHEMQMKIQL